MDLESSFAKLLWLTQNQANDFHNWKSRVFKRLFCSQNQIIELNENHYICYTCINVLNNLLYIKRHMLEILVRNDSDDEDDETNISFNNVFPRSNKIWTLLRTRKKNCRSHRRDPIGVSYRNPHGFPRLLLRTASTSYSKKWTLKTMIRSTTDKDVNGDDLEIRT